MVHVLGAQGDLRAGDRPAHGVEIAARRANGQIDALDRLGLFRHALGQGHGRGAIQVHLPIAGNKRTSHRWCSSRYGIGNRLRRWLDGRMLRKTTNISTVEGEGTRGPANRLRPAKYPAHAVCRVFGSFACDYRQKH